MAHFYKVIKILNIKSAVSSQLTATKSAIERVRDNSLNGISNDLSIALALKSIANF